MARFKPNLFNDVEFNDGDPTTQERRVARALSGRRQPGSGSSMYAKGDVKQRSSEAFDLNRFLIECKQTKNASLSVKAEWLSKITQEAMAAGLEPALQFDIKGQKDGFVERDWIAVPLSVFKRILDKS